MNRALIAVLGLILFAACKNEKETPNGFTYTLVKSGEGDIAKIRELVVFDYQIVDSKDSVWLDSKREGFPGAYQIQDSLTIASEIGMQQMFRLLVPGDSITVTKPVKQFFKEVMGGRVPPATDTTMNMTCNLRVIDIMDEQEFQKYQSGLVEKKREKQTAKDAADIEKYLKENNINAERDSSGIHYVVHEQKNGAKPTVENCVEVSYLGKLLSNGEIFDQNDKLAFPLRGVIEGWQIGIPKLGIGDSATFYIPSSLGYGPSGNRGIPPDAVLVFSVRLLGIKQFDPATRSCK